MPAQDNIVHFHELPEIILFNIFSLVSDIRTRNTMSLVCLKWCLLERSSRISLALRGNIRNLLYLPTCFRAVTNLDISFLSPWGNELLDKSCLDSMFFAQLFRHAFPSLVSLTIYSRNPSTLALLAPQWPNLRHVKLIRWHQRMSATLGADFLPLLEHCRSLCSLDLSHFYCYPEDLPPALQAYPIVASSLAHLNILNNSSGEGYKSHELLAITSACKNLRQLLATCIFDNRLTGFTGDETLLSLASNCPLLSLLHLIDATNSFSYEDAKVLSHATVIELCAALPFLEELVLDVCHNGASMELLNANCPRLKSLTLGKFRGICRGIDSRHGIAQCSVLESLCIKNSADLTDSGLIAISLGCPKLTKFEVHCCKRITEIGIRNLASNLRKTLIDVKISCCKHLNAVCSLRALGPIQDLIQRLHIDCVWESVQELQGEDRSLKKKCKFHNNGNGNRFSSMSWEKLHYLSLWIPVSQLLIPLTLVGLEDCPALEEIQIKIEGDVTAHS